MVVLSRLVVALAVSGLFTAPLYADVIPSQYPAQSEARGKVEKRLVEMGVKPGDAHHKSERLMDDEAAYFAQNPERVQVAGQEMWAGQSDNLWWEWVFGAAALVGAIVLVWYETAGRD